MSVHDPIAELWTAAQAASVDRHTMDGVGVPSVVLMERAALACAHEVLALRGPSHAAVLVLVGPGNNGGDGLALARQLHGWGISVRAHLVTREGNAMRDQQRRLAFAAGLPILEALPSSPPIATEILVDALLGTGATGAPRGAIEAALSWAEGHRGPRLAVDVPSGVDPSTGRVSGRAFRADVTVTFGRSKPGLHVTPGRAAAGRVVVADIGLVVPDGLNVACELVDPRWVAEQIGSLPLGRHKGERGHVAILGGSAGTTGAAVLTGAAALRTGAGLVTVVTDDHEVRAQLVAYRPELMVTAREVTPVPGADALVVGPGLTDPAQRHGLVDLWHHDPRPAIWDASALDEIPVAGPGAQGHTAGPRIITPHPGEAARLLTRCTSEAWSSARVQSHRLDSAQVLAQRLGAVVVLKGEGSLVAKTDGTVAVCVTGGPGLATAGTGDCLAGVLGALLARGMTADNAARVGVHVHGTAGDLARARRPVPVALDVADAIDSALAQGVPAAWPRWRRS